MKITRDHLGRIIREELARELREVAELWGGTGLWGQMGDKAGFHTSQVEFDWGQYSQDGSHSREMYYIRSGRNDELGEVQSYGDPYTYTKVGQQAPNVMVVSAPESGKQAIGAVIELEGAWEIAALETPSDEEAPEEFHTGPEMTYDRQPGQFFGLTQGVPPGGVAYIHENTWMKGVAGFFPDPESEIGARGEARPMQFGTEYFGREPRYQHFNGVWTSDLPPLQFGHEVFSPQAFWWTYYSTGPEIDAISDPFIFITRESEAFMTIGPGQTSTRVKRLSSDFEWEGFSLPTWNTLENTGLSNPKY